MFRVNDISVVINTALYVLVDCVLQYYIMVYINYNLLLLLYIYRANDIDVDVYNARTVHTQSQYRCSKY